jgi:hypothetical protein
MVWRSLLSGRKWSGRDAHSALRCRQRSRGASSQSSTHAAAPSLADAAKAWRCVLCFFIHTHTTTQSSPAGTVRERRASHNSTQPKNYRCCPGNSECSEEFADRQI